jgi:hypothetical protein
MSIDDDQQLQRLLIGIGSIRFIDPIQSINPIHRSIQSIDPIESIQSIDRSDSSIDPID